MKAFTLLKIISGLAIVFTVSCNLFKNTTSNSTKAYQLNETKSELSLDAKIEEGTQLSLLSFYKDSSDRIYSVELWPRGVFKFSPDVGFEGEADKLLISGHTQQIKDASSLLNNNQQKEIVLKIDDQYTEKLVKDQNELVKTSTVSWKWTLLIVLICCGLVYLFIYKFKT